VLGEVAFEAGNADEASHRFKRSLTVCREAGDKRGGANALRGLARVDLHAGDLAPARLRLADALRAFRAFEMREELLAAIEDHAELAAAEGRVETAVALAAATTKARERLGLARTRRAERRWQATLARLRRTMNDAPFESAWNEAAHWHLDEAVRQSLSPQAERATV
jgi:hypothetical protein